MAENKEKQETEGKRKYTHPDFNKTYLIQETAKRANFTRADVKIVFNALESVMFDLIREKKSFYWRQLFSFQIHHLKDYKKKNFFNGKIIDIKGSIRFSFTPSKFLHKLIATKPEEDMPKYDEECADDWDDTSLVL